MKRFDRFALRRACGLAALLSASVVACGSSDSNGADAPVSGGAGGAHEGAAGATSTAGHSGMASTGMAGGVASSGGGAGGNVGGSSGGSALGGNGGAGGASPPSRACSDLSDGKEVYAQTFDKAVGTEWSNGAEETAPSGEKFLGRFHGDDSSTASAARVRLSLAALPAHTTIHVELDLYLVGTWNGNAQDWSGDHFFGLRAYAPKATSATQLLRASFSNNDDKNMKRNLQSFPDSYLVGEHPARTGSLAKNALEYPNGGDVSYHLVYDFNHAADALSLEFFGQNLGNDQTWGLDNVHVTALGGALVNRVSITSAVPGKIYVDDAYTGVSTPASVDLGQGKHMVGLFTDDGRYQHQAVTLNCDNPSLAFTDGNWEPGHDWKFLVVALTHLDFDFSNVGSNNQSGHCKATAPSNMGQAAMNVLNAVAPLVSNATGGLVHWKPTLMTLDRPQTAPYTNWIGEDQLPEVVSAVGWAEYDYVLVLFPGYAKGCNMDLGIFGATGATDLSVNSRGAGWGNYPTGDTAWSFDSYDGWAHEWGHSIEWLMQSHGGRLPWSIEAAVHSGVAYGYQNENTPNPSLPGQNWNWFRWYRDLFSGQVQDHLFTAYPTGAPTPGFVGVGPEAWIATTVRGYSQAVYPNGR